MSPTPDPYNLQRFVAAQEPVYSEVLAELTQGSKRGHWMWLVFFPQVAGLGRSETARFYAIGSRGEAEAYLKHDVLGPPPRGMHAARDRGAGPHGAAAFRATR